MAQKLQRILQNDIAIGRPCGPEITKTNTDLPYKSVVGILQTTMGRPCEPFLGNLHLNENWSTKKPLQYRQDCQCLDLHQVSAPITDLAKKSIGLTAHTPLSHRIDRALKEFPACHCKCHSFHRQLPSKSDQPKIILIQCELL